MRISVLCSDFDHPIQPLLSTWRARQPSGFAIELVTKSEDLSGGDMLFLISCHEIIRTPVRSLYRHCLVVHASDLPHGKGWSPHIWNILAGSDHLTVTLFEADDGLDTGPIWAKERIPLTGTELYDEINDEIFEATISLLDFAVENSGMIAQPQPAVGPVASFPRRTPEDSRIDPFKSLADQFDLLRIADPDRYPAFFDFRDQRYSIAIRKMPKQSSS